MVDVEPLVRERFDKSYNVREELAEKAATAWAADLGPPSVPVVWPATIDGINCRSALRAAQQRDPMLSVVIRQLNAEQGKSSGQEAKMGYLKPLELQEYRLNPLDVVLERRVILGDAR